MTKFCLVINGDSYYKPFDHLGLQFTNQIDILRYYPHKVGLVVFTGGEDISPHLYDHDNVCSYTNPSRDVEEVEVYEMALSAKIPMAGICRGAQFLCAMAGGKIVQDITHHGQNHHVRYITEDGGEATSPEPITSTHHQMQFPWSIGDQNFDILAWSEAPRSRHYQFGHKRILAKDAGRQFTIEPDVVYYRNINALAMQYHPEWMSNDSWGMKFARNLISDFLLRGKAPRV